MAKFHTDIKQQAKWQLCIFWALYAYFENCEGGGWRIWIKLQHALHQCNLLLFNLCMPFLFITTITTYLNFAMFRMVNLLFLQYCTAAVDVNSFIRFNKILLHLHDKRFSFSSRSHVCLPSVPHAVIYSERKKGLSLMACQKAVPVSKTLYFCRVLQALCYLSDKISSIW
jgi:hypothetical protein